MHCACEIVDAQRDSIANLVAGLMERDTLNADEIQECFGFAKRKTQAA